MFPLGIKDKLLMGAVAVLAVSLLIVMAYYKVTVGALKHKVAQQAEEIVQLETVKAALTKANTLMAESINAQNAGIDQLKKEQEKASAAAAAKIAETEKQAALMQGKYSALLNKPRTTQGECVDAHNLLKDYVRERSIEP